MEKIMSSALEIIMQKGFSQWTSTVVVLHYIPYKNGMLGHEVGGRRCKNAQKQFIIRAH